jgi:hypothetical protein
LIYLPANEGVAVTEIVLVVLAMPVFAASIAWFWMASKMRRALETSPIWATALRGSEFENPGWILGQIKVMAIVIFKLYREAKDPDTHALGERMRRLLSIYMGCLALWVGVVILRP